MENVLILQGGGSLGAYECGVFKVLYEQNIKFDIVAGTSIGAVNASIISASKYNPAKALEEFWLDIADKFTPEYLPYPFNAFYSLSIASIFGNPKVFKPRWFNPYDDWTYLYDLEPLKDTLMHYIDLDNLRNRLIITATDIQRSEPVAFDSNSILGDEIKWLKPTGPFGLIDEWPDGRKETRRIVMMGGGTGLAPFISMTLHLKAKRDKREIVVLHGASYVDELSYRELLTDLEEESLDKGRDEWNFRYRATISRPDEWFNRSWGGHKGRVETFLKKDPTTGKSALEELVGEKITPENTMFYVCGWQGTVDGVLQYLEPLGFVEEKKKRPDKTYDIRYESYG
jgi:NAD(P)H-flavin reductase